MWLASCPHCQATYRVPANQAGAPLRTMNCVQCHRSFTASPISLDAPLSAQTQRRTIWVVTSDPLLSRPQVREALLQLEQNCHVECVPTLAEASERLVQGAPQALLFGDLDVLGDASTLKALSRCGAHRLLLSTHMNQDLLALALSTIGVDTHLPLPFTADTIVDRVSRALSKAA